MFEALGLGSIVLLIYAIYMFFWPMMVHGVLKEILKELKRR